MTGIQLTIGAGASLDHVTPVSRGGDHSEGNLRWVSVAVNTAKSDLSDREFARLCAAVLRGPLARLLLTDDDPANDVTPADADTG